VHHPITRRIKSLLTLPLLMGAALVAPTQDATSKLAPDLGDRIENRLDNRGDRIEHRFDRRGDRTDNRLDRRGERIDNRLDRRGRHAGDGQARPRRR